MTRDEFLAKYRHDLAGRIVYASVLKVTKENICEWTQNCVLSIETLLGQMYADLVPPTKGPSK